MPDLGGFNQILFFLLVITPIVFIHELGHYWVARRSGVVVDVFPLALARNFMPGQIKMARAGVLGHCR